MVERCLEFGSATLVIDGLWGREEGVAAVAADDGRSEEAGWVLR